MTQSTTASTLCSPVSPNVGTGERTRGGLVATWFGLHRIAEAKNFTKLQTEIRQEQRDLYAALERAAERI